jgi:hypothetical protein
MTILTAVPHASTVAKVNPVTGLFGQWYNAVVRQLSLSSKSFLLQHPVLPLPLTAGGVWSLFDAVPPMSLVHNLRGPGMGRFYSNYCALINQLLPRVRDNIREVLGDDLAPWCSYVNRIQPPPKVTELADVFYAWATVNCPHRAAPGRMAFLDISNDPINAAVRQMTDRSGFMNGAPDFGIVLSDVKVAIRNASGAVVTFDSAKESGDATRTWAGGSIPGVGWSERFLTGRDGDEGWRKINEKASTSQVLVEASFDNVATVAGAPGGWYSPVAFSLAYQGKEDEKGWRHDIPGWDGVFGARGSLCHLVGSLVLVDGIKVKMTSTAQYSPDEQRHIEESFGGGVWPFVGMDGHGGISAKVKFDKDGAAVFTTSSPPGNIQVFGANVVPVSAYVG